MDLEQKQDRNPESQPGLPPLNNGKATAHLITSVTHTPVTSELIANDPIDLLPEAIQNLYKQMNLDQQPQTQAERIEKNALITEHNKSNPDTQMKPWDGYDGPIVMVEPSLQDGVLNLGEVSKSRYSFTTVMRAATEQSLDTSAVSHLQLNVSLLQPAIIRGPDGQNKFGLIVTIKGSGTLGEKSIHTGFVSGGVSVKNTADSQMMLSALKKESKEEVNHQVDAATILFLVNEENQGMCNLTYCGKTLNEEQVVSVLENFNNRDKDYYQGNPEVENVLFLEFTENGIEGYNNDPDHPVIKGAKEIYIKDGKPQLRTPLDSVGNKIESFDQLRPHTVAICDIVLEPINAKKLISLASA